MSDLVDCSAEDRNIGNAIAFALRKNGKSNFVLKEEQKDAIHNLAIEGRDVLAVLPTGFGKSLIFQLLPFVFDYLSGKSLKSSIIVISPLNGLICDQIEKLKSYMDVGVLQINDGGDNVSSSMAFEDTMKSQLIFAHPEVFVNNKTIIKKIVQDDKIQVRIKAIVVDEAHLIEEWKDFRPAYQKLGLMSTIFPSCPKLALTATATASRKDEICRSLGLSDMKCIEINPDRRNIFFNVFQRPNKGDEKLHDVLHPLVEELKNQNVAAQKTLIYGSMEIISECYSFFDRQLGKYQYYPTGAKQCAANRMFTQYHANYPPREQARILKEVVKINSIIRFLFVTVAFGMGIDCPDIRRVIHIGPPRTMEEYFQEAGRAGRDGNPAISTIYYNSYDISKAKKSMQEVMRTLVSANECRRKVILQHFGYEIIDPLNPMHMCCDVHKEQCTCPSCSDIHDETVNEFDKLKIADCRSIEDNDPIADLPDPPLSMYNELLAYRQSLLSSRTCVGSTSLSSGFSLELIDAVVKTFHQINSVDDIVEMLPVFSRSNAYAIYAIICKYK